MAAPPPQVPTVPNTPLLNRYRQDEDTHAHTRLPSGPCNYINVHSGHGGHVPRCGCRRFTEKPLELYGGSGQTRPGLCFCEHHSCFHDHEPVDGPRVLVGVPAAEAGVSLTPRPLSVYRQSPAPRDRDTGMQDIQLEVGRQVKSDYSLPDTLHWTRYIKSGSSPGSLPAIPSQCLLPSDDGSRASSSQAGNMRPFAGLGLNTLSHVPKTSSSGLEGQLDERRLQVYEDSAGRQFMQSLTEIATPSLHSSQDLDAGVAFGNNVVKVQSALQRISEERSQGLRPNNDRCRTGSHAGLSATITRHEEDDDNLLPRIRSIINHVADYPTKIQNHETRLDHLENASFSNAAIDELEETTGDLDTRVGGLECRVDELEKTRIAQSDAGSFAGRQHLGGSVDSVMSNTSSALIAAAIDGVDYARIEALEAQVSELRASAPPTQARPWEVEVVFIPFGFRLNGIWSSQHPTTQPSRMNSTAGDDTQTQNNSMTLTQAYLTAQDEDVSWESSMKRLGDEQDPWLMPKAFGLQSGIGERLKSRGLVKLLQIRGPDARDVQAAMLSAFGDLPNLLADDPFSSHHHRRRQPIPSSLNNYLGLHNPWIPLRKLHKDKNLRFLNTSEMVTPALWTVSFLTSSIAMMAGGTPRRLYVTQPDSYIQQLRDGSAEWTWQKLRQLPRVYPDAETIDHTPEADAHEPCWEFDVHLDPPPSIQSSFASHHSSLSLTFRPNPYEQVMEPTSPSDHFSSQPASPIPSTTPTSIAPPPPTRPLSALKELHPFRPVPHTRTTSMPSIIPIKTSSPSISISIPKRRMIPSFEHEHDPHSPPSRTIPTMLKRRRTRTRSPSRPLDTHTPRYSAGPPSLSPSPYAFAAADDVGEREKRGVTPFAYATPFSNAPPYFESSRYMRDDGDEDGDEGGSVTDEMEMEMEHEGYDIHALSDYDSHVPSDVDVDVDHQPDEDVWEGVQDDESRPNLTLILPLAHPLTTTTNNKTIGLRQDDDEHEDEDEDQASEASSSPSEYSSRQPESEAVQAEREGEGLLLYSEKKVTKAKTGFFMIHVDEDEDQDQEIAIENGDRD